MLRPPNQVKAAGQQELRQLWRSNCMIESHLSQHIEQIKQFIGQIAATKLQELASGQTACMQARFDNMAKVSS